MYRFKAQRWAKLAAVAALSTLALTACGSDPAPSNTTSGEPSSSSSSSASAPASDLACPSGKLTAEGSTAQANAIAEVISGYGGACNNASEIEYNPTGSGAGIKSFYNSLVDFAGSDSALKTTETDGLIEAEKAKERCGGNEAWNLPMVVGPVAFAYNVDGVDKLVLTPEVLAKIFNGTIKTWNDPAITALNAGVTLPSNPITVFFRSDESGTTENVTTFLKEASNGAWTKDPGKSWTGTGEGKNKSSGIAEGITATKNSISYVEWSYAQDNELKMAQIDNGAGPVELTAANVAKAVDGAEITGTGNDLRLKLKYADTEAGAYPALLVTYEIACSKGLDADKTALLKDFLTYFASADTQASLEEIGSAPLPDSLRTKVTAAVAAIQ